MRWGAECKLSLGKWIKQKNGKQEKYNSVIQKKKKKKSFINITRELEVIQGRMEATELRNKNISEPH